MWVIWFGAGLFVFLIGFVFFMDEYEIRSAHQFVKDCHGDLPPAESLANKGYSLLFLATLAQYYRYDKRLDKALTTARSRRKFIMDARRSKPPPAATPIDPSTEDDCPECANGMEHSLCRSGWKAVLTRAATRRR